MSSTTVPIPVADCEPVDIQKDIKPEPIQLCQTFAKEAKSPLWTIQRAAQYAEDPTGYLKKILGEETFNERLPKLCIPEAIDRDFYGKGNHMQNFEQHIAKLLGKEHGLFFITGIQAQLVALNIYCRQAGNVRVAWHLSSHLESAEEDAYKNLYGLHRVLMGENPEENPNVEEIKAVLSLPEHSRPVAILLEIPNRTLGCKTYTFEDLETISKECRKANVKLHCDGARLWDGEAYYEATAGKSFADIGALFDSLYVSFYKGLGGAGGAILATNDPEVINEAKVGRRRAGGNTFNSSYQVIDDERGFNENIGAFARRREKMIEVVDLVKKEIERYKSKEGVPYVKFIPEIPTCCQVHTLFQGFSADGLKAARDKVEEKTGIRVFENLRAKQSVDEILKKERDAASKSKQGGDTVAETASSSDLSHFMEWMIVNQTEQIDSKFFVDGYRALCEELAALPAKS